MCSKWLIVLRVEVKAEPVLIASDKTFINTRPSLSRDCEDAVSSCIYCLAFLYLRYRFDLRLLAKDLFSNDHQRTHTHTHDVSRNPPYLEYFRTNKLVRYSLWCFDAALVAFIFNACSSLWIAEEFA